MAKMMETVLYYNPGRPETMKHVAMMKGVLVRMGIRIRNVASDQVLKTVGYLAGMDGFGPEEEVTGTQEGMGELPEIPVEMLVLKQFSDRRLEELLVNLRKAGVPKIELKAVLTENNSAWSFFHLYEELKEEHQAMAAGKGQ